MTINATTLKIFRNLGFVTMAIIVIAGFILPVTIVNALIISPSALLLLMGINAYINKKLETNTVSAEIHMFPHCSNHHNHTGEKAA